MGGVEAIDHYIEHKLNRSLLRQISGLFILATNISMKKTKRVIFHRQRIR